jgi:hypothetical protein
MKASGFQELFMANKKATRKGKSSNSKHIDNMILYKVLVNTFNAVAEKIAV